MRTRVIAILVALLCANIRVLSQTENAAFSITGHGLGTTFSTDYQAIGINPANLDIASQFEGRRYALGFSEIGASFYSGILSKTDIRKNLFGGNFDQLSREEKAAYALEFAQENNALDLDIMSTGFSFQTNKAGSFAFSVRDKVDYYSKLGPQVSDLLWLGNTSDYFTQYILSTGDTINGYPNISPDSLALIVQGLNLDNPQSIGEITRGTSIRFSWVREFNLSYGKLLLSTEDFKIFGGVGLKLLVGQGYMEIQNDNGKAEGFSSLSPIFDIDYSEISENNPSALPDDKKLKPVGLGYGFDLGATVVVKDKLYFSAAVTDIGSMTWDGNVYSLKDVVLSNYISSGIENLQLTEQLEALNGGDGLVEWEGEGSITTKLPAMMRGGVSFIFNNKFKAGVDIVNSLNNEVGSLEKANIAFGGEFSPLKWLHFSAGYMTGGNYVRKIPAGIRFTPGNGKYEIGFASRDLITFFTDNQPTVSLAMGFLRFRF
ncbi:MAG: DUF5723 family protein [Flavobacteriales bacterium]|jgi:hypothetical protein